MQSGPRDIGNQVHASLTALADGELDEAGAKLLARRILLNQKIGKIIPQYCSIFIKDLKRMLLLHIQICLTQTMCQSIFVYFL